MKALILISLLLLLFGCYTGDDLLKTIEEEIEEDEKEDGALIGATQSVVCSTYHRMGGYSFPKWWLYI